MLATDIAAATKAAAISLPDFMLDSLFFSIFYRDSVNEPTQTHALSALDGGSRAVLLPMRHSGRVDGCADQSSDRTLVG